MQIQLLLFVFKLLLILSNFYITTIINYIKVFLKGNFVILMIIQIR
jgi:hypothetical protein